MAPEHQPRDWKMNVAVREQVPVLVGISGPSGCGKTLSMLRIMRGISQVTGDTDAVIDTEAKRALHYAGDFDPPWHHIPFEKPFSSLLYRDAIAFAKTKAGVIGIDSMSHEHDGEGGMLDFQAEELKRLGGGAKNNMRAWVEPKARRRKLMGEIVQGGGHYVFTFRAKNTVKPGKNRGDDFVEMGFTAITGDEFPYEMTIGIYLPPNSGGVPDWEPEHLGEQAMVKLPGWARDFFRGRGNKPLDEECGRFLAEWARGGASTVADKAKLLDAIRAEMKSQGFAERSPADRQDAMRKYFGVGTWPKVTELDADDLEAGLAALKRETDA